MTSMIRARAKLACEIAGIEPQKLNEAVHYGHLQCVPATVPGAPRIFDCEGILMLSIYGTLLAHGMASAAAGKIACEVFDWTRRDLEGRVGEARYYLRPHFYPEGGVDRPILLLLEGGGLFLDGGVTPVGANGVFADSASFICFPIKALRASIKSQLERERDNPVLGED